MTSLTALSKAEYLKTQKVMVLIVISYFCNRKTIILFWPTTFFCKVAHLVTNYQDVSEGSYQ